MKEQFDKRRFVGTLNIACKFDDGSVRNWTADKSLVISQIQEIVEYYQELGYKLTLRQLHYQFVSRNWIINHDTAYKKLGKILDDCRYGGLVDWDAIEDRGRVPFLPYYVQDIPNALQDTINQYRLDRQSGQSNHVEVWTEKDALSGIMKRSTSKYGVRLVVNKGYTSSSAIYSAYQRFCRYDKVTILYFGDHDPSGLDMVRDIKERLEFMFENGDVRPDIDFKVIPIGLTMEQIKKYKCPPNPTKLTDSRAAKYIKKFGKTCWEVDALNPEVLTEVVETNIKSQIDSSMYENILKQEKKDIVKLKKIVDES
jgi:hypothetical protein